MVIGLEPFSAHLPFRNYKYFYLYLSEFKTYHPFVVSWPLTVCLIIIHIISTAAQDIFLSQQSKSFISEAVMLKGNRLLSSLDLTNAHCRHPVMALFQ